MPTIVSVSLPSDLLPVLHAEASRQGRSRSFVVAEAIREYVRRQDRDSFTAARDATLREGLDLTPADRLQLAEDLWQELTAGRELSSPWHASFNTFDEYERWRREQAARVA